MNETSPNRLESGDMVMVISKTGEIRTFGVDINPKDFFKEEDDLTEEERNIVTNGTIMFALVQAAMNPQVLAQLIQISKEAINLDIANQILSPN